MAKKTAKTNSTVRLSDIAKRAKCSVATVSHALTGSGTGKIRVNPLRIKEIQKLAEEMGYRPNYAARQLAGKKSGIIGFITDVLQTATHTRMSAWLQSHATTKGLKVLIAQTNNDDGKMLEAVNEFTSRGLDGIIYSAYLNDQHWPAACRILKPCPNVVSVFGRPPIPNSHFIDVDVAEGIRQAVTHLAERGRSRIVLIRTFLEETDWSRERERGFINTHRQLGRSEESFRILHPEHRIDWNEPDINSKIEQLVNDLIDKHKADAVITDDTVAGLLASGFLRNGRARVPEDVAIVGHRNDITVHYTYPPLTTVDMMVSEVMERAVDLLENRDGVNQSQVVVPNLIIREST